MTDVPFVALATWSSLAMILALRRRSEAWLAAAALGAALAVGVRAVGVVLPVAMALTLLVAAGRWGRHPRRVALALLPLAAFAALAWRATTQVHVVTDLADVYNSPINRVRYLSYGLRALPQSALDALGSTTLLGLALSPLLLAGIQRRQIRASLAAAAALAALLGIAGLGDPAYKPPLAEDSVWALRELGPAESLVPAYRAHRRRARDVAPRARGVALHRARRRRGVPTAPHPAVRGVPGVDAASGISGSSPSCGCSTTGTRSPCSRPRSRSC